jgi:hypothetical protein
VVTRAASPPACEKTGGDDKRLSLSDFHSIPSPGGIAQLRRTKYDGTIILPRKLEVDLSTPAK